MVHDFFIGYAPTNGDALVKFLTKKGFSNKELSQAGLTNRFGGDIFRGRIVIALSDSMGRVVGFTGRTIVNDEKSPKYLNTPQTILYDKSRHVFGLAQAKEAIRKSDYAVIVEGNMDVISSHQAGVCNAVATAGTAMTEHHLRALSRLTGNIRLAFDSDKAGLDATERAISLAQNVGVDLTIISLAENAKDPDELIKKDTKLWQEAIDKAEPAVDWLLKHYSKREKLDTAVGKRKFTNLALKVVRKLKDPVEQEHYLQKVADYTQTSLEVIKSK
jgi:DNA primase